MMVVDRRLLASHRRNGSYCSSDAEFSMWPWGRFLGLCWRVLYEINPLDIHSGQYMIADTAIGQTDCLAKALRCTNELCEANEKKQWDTYMHIDPRKIPLHKSLKSLCYFAFLFASFHPDFGPKVQMNQRIKGAICCNSVDANQVAWGNIAGRLEIWDA